MHIFGYGRRAVGAVRSLLSRRGWLRAGIIVLGFVVGISIISRFFGGSAVEPTLPDTRAVEVRSVLALINEGEPLSVIGTVSSRSEATVLAQKTGEVTRIYRQLGDYVTAGSIIAELENASERAAVAQAQAGVEAAEASAGVSQTTLTAARSSAVTSLLTAYAAVDNAVHSDIDPMFSNPSGVNPQFNIVSSNSQAKTDAENGRLVLGLVLGREQSRITTLSTDDDLISEFALTEAELRQVRDFLDDVIATLNAGVAAYNITDATITTYKATAVAARTTITTSLSSITSARQTLQTALQNSAEGSGNISSASAALKQAQAALAVTQASLERTIIRAPISGTVNSLSLDLGNFIQASTPVVTIANNSALEVEAYLTESDARDVRVGAPVSVDSGRISVRGTVTRVAPALDPVTKKIEVRVGLTDGAGTLINGQSVTLAIERTVQTSGSVPSRIIIPISALKIGANGISVFTVSTSSTLVAHPVVVGTLLGDKVVVEEGLTLDMEIVVDARGFQENEEVEVR